MSINTESLCFSYKERVAVCDVSLTLNPGMFYGILGPNGCGKTTLIDLLIRHQVPESGTVNYKGKPFNQYTRKQIAREIALVPQYYAINFPFTSQEIVMMGRYPHIDRFSFPNEKDREMVDAVMEQTECLSFKNRYISELSGGERQRVIFARALVQDTPVLFLDEATSNLDISHSISLFGLALKKVHEQGTTVVAVMQDINLAALFCNYLFFMKNGRIVHHGPCEQVLTEEVIKSVFQVNSKVYEDSYAKSRHVVFSRTSHIQWEEKGI